MHDQHDTVGSESLMQFLDFTDRLLTTDDLTTDYPPGRRFELIDIRSPLWSQQIHQSTDYLIAHIPAEDSEESMAQSASQANNPAQLDCLEVGKRTQAVLTTRSFEHDYLTKRVDFYFQNLHCRMPVLEETSVRQLLSHGPDTSQNPQLSCLLLALCSASGLQEISMNQQCDESLLATSREMFDQVLLQRANVAYKETATFETIVTSVLLVVCCVELRAWRSSRHFLQEALLDARELDILREAIYPTLSIDEATRYGRLHVLLFVMERANSGFQPGLIHIRRAPRFPEDLLPGETSTSVMGFRKVFELFEAMDEILLDLSEQEQDGFRVTKSQISPTDYVTRQVALARVYDTNDDCCAEGIAEIQRVNIHVTQQWLHLLLWQVALRQGLLSSNSTSIPLTYRYPLILARNLCEHLSTTASEVMFAHGIDLVGYLASRIRDQKRMTD